MANAGDLNRPVEQLEGSVKSFDAESRTQAGKGGDAVTNPTAVQGPGGDSRPDPVNPEGAGFVDVSDSELQTTTRDPGDMPPIERGSADELNATRHDDSRVVEKPTGPNLDEGAAIAPPNPGGDDS